MTIREVLTSDWRSLLDRYSRQHRAWLGTVHVVPASGLEIVARSGALETVSVDDQSSRDLVRLSFFDEPPIYVERPRELRIEQNDRGAERALEIETAAGTFLRLAFRATALPEEVDGLAPREVDAVRDSGNLVEKHPAA